jgi:hypothetical protein
MITAAALAKDAHTSGLAYQGFVGVSLETSPSSVKIAASKSLLETGPSTDGVSLE